MASSCYFLEESGVIKITGHWILNNYAELLSIKNTLKNKENKPVDYSQIEQLDTNGTYLLIECLGHEQVQQGLKTHSFPSKYAQLVQVVLQASTTDTHSLPKPSNRIIEFLANFGQSVLDFKYAVMQWLSFLGETLSALFVVLLHPKKWRVTSLVANIDVTGFQAVPIVMLLNFMVGAVVAFLGATVLANFGATIYTVHLVAFSFLREFAVLLSAILLAGRTASAYAAQIGSMKVNEEIDALATNGINPINILVLPRVWALIVSLPLLTFLAMVAGILGGLAVCTFMLGISSTLFFDIVGSVDIRHFFVGLSKAPLFAIVIAITGCLEGFKVKGSAQSVGERTTSSVVQSIFLVILLDAVAAIFFMEMGW